MKPNLPRESEERLDELLREWKVETRLAPDFQDQVWRRVARAEATETIGFGKAARAWLENVLPRPAIALAYVTVLLALGASTGLLQARHEAHRLEAALSLRYAQSLDPYLVTSSLR